MFLSRFLGTLPILFLPVLEPVYAQTAFDSLKKQLEVSRQEDTARVMLLNRLSFLATEPEVAKRYADDAVSLATKINDQKGLGHAYYQQSQYYWKKTDSEKAIEFALKALRLFEMHFPAGVSVCYTMIGINLADQKEIEQSLQYHRKALALDIKNNKPSKIASDYINIGNIYHDHKKQFDSAIYYYTKSHELLNTINDPHQMVLVFNNLGSAHSYRGNHNLALQYLNRAMPMAVSQNHADQQALLHQTLGEVHVRLGELSKAQQHLETALKIANTLGNKRRKEEVYSHLINLAVLQKNTGRALALQTALLQLRDTLYNVERFRQIAEMETRYESEKKAQQIVVLEQDKEIQALWQNLLIAALIIFLMAAYLIFQWLKKRAERAKQLLASERELNEKLTSIAKLKSELYAQVAHEFRTPLTLILAPIENEIQKSQPSTTPETLLTIRRNANRLLELINQLLDLSKLESGKMSLDLTRGNLHTVVKTTVEGFDALAKKQLIQYDKNITLTEQHAWFDSDKIQKILSNLLSNAFKFTPTSGMVRVHIYSVDDCVCFEIADTGIGITKGDQQHLFTPYFQANQKKWKHQPGTGLGLALVKQLVELNQGSISIESDPGVGTTVSVKLPLIKDGRLFEDDNPADIPHQTNAIPPPASVVNVTEVHGDSVLIVEDNEELRTFIEQILSQNGFKVYTAYDGRDGLSKAFDVVPDLIVSDLVMPVLDGIELTKTCKDDERTSHIPVVLLTANSEQNTKLIGLKTGADDYLTKPFSTEELIVRINNLIQQRKKLAKKFREQIFISTPTNELPLDERFIQNARDVVEKNISNSEFSVEQLADHMNLSRTQLLRKLKALTGFSPSDFIRSIRLQKAARMIRQRVDTVTQIAYAVGFNDQSYFAKSFKKEFGVSPTEYSSQSALID